MNHYQILGVKQTASQKEIKDAYKKLIKKYHPDIYKGDKSFAERKSQELNTAYDILSNPELKAAYDEELNPTPTYEYTPPKYDSPKSYYGSDSTYNNRGSNFYSNSYASATYKKVNEMHNKFSNNVIQSVTKMQWMQRLILILIIILVYLVILLTFFTQYNKLDFSRTTTSYDDTSDYRYIRSTKDRKSFSIYDLGFTEEDLREVYTTQGYDRLYTFEQFKTLLEDKLFSKLYGY